MPSGMPGPRLPVTRADLRLADLVDALERLGAPCALVLPDGFTISCGDGEPRFRLVLRTERLLERRITQLALAEAYLARELDIEADGEAGLFAALDLRDELPTGVPLRQAAGLARDLLTPAVRANRRAIGHHYALDDNFFLAFLDDKHHFYSQGVWREGATTLAEAADAKLERMREMLGLRPGMHVLDIGGGWGGLAAWCVAEGVSVTSLTLTRESADTIRRRIREAPARDGATGEVLVEDFLEHRPRKPYDHVVIFGVIEHIPNYRRFCRRLWSVLGDGGRLFLDASATREKYAASAFTRDHTWRGPHSCLALPDLLQELLFAGFDVESVQRDSGDYEDTMREWARRFDADHARIAATYGERTYRAFRLFLWGGAHGFARDRLQAYSLVAARGERPGPRPGALRRLGHVVGSAVSR
jgi:cyclopropane-fatty-acyl-phospholipid synthase